MKNSTNSSIGSTTPSDMSISLWFNTDSENKNVLASFSPNFNLVENPVAVDKVIFMDLSKKMNFAVRNASGTVEKVTTAAAYGDRKWHHLVATYTASSPTLKIYVDGVMNSAPVTISPVSRAGYWRIGCSENGDGWSSGADLVVGELKWWDQYISQVSVYPTTLTQTQVDSLFAVGKPVIEFTPPTTT